MPLWFHRPDDELFAFAGVWAEYTPRGAEPIHSCAIVTCAPNELMRPIHDRMPVILDPAMEALWLDPDADEDEIRGLLVPVPDDALLAQEVGDLVSNVREDGPQLIEPRAETTLF